MARDDFCKEALRLGKLKTKYFIVRRENAK